MKCIQVIRTGDVGRIDDETAWSLVKHGLAFYVPKGLWKKDRADKLAAEAAK